MTTTKSKYGWTIQTELYKYLNGRRSATIHFSTPLTEEQIDDYILELNVDAFRAINADLALEGKHLEVPLVRVGRLADQPTASIEFAEYREDPDYGDADY